MTNFYLFDDLSRPKHEEGAFTKDGVLPPRGLDIMDDLRLTHHGGTFVPQQQPGFPIVDPGRWDLRGQLPKMTHMNTAISGSVRDYSLLQPTLRSEQYHVPCYGPKRRQEEDAIRHTQWMEMMSGGFTQSCSNWSMIKLLLPETFVNKLTTIYFPAVKLMLLRSECVLSFSKENTTMDANDGQKGVNNAHYRPTRLVLAASLDLTRLVYCVTWLVEVYFCDTLASNGKNFNVKRPFVVKSVLPRSSISRFIGRGGETIRTVQEGSHLSISVSTLDRNVSERVLNMGFCIQSSTNYSNTLKFESLLSVFHVIIDILQTDRNYSMNYSPIQENTGRPRVQASAGRSIPTKDDLINLIRKSDVDLEDGIMFDDMPEFRIIEDIMQLKESALRCLQDIKRPHQSLVPAPIWIIDNKPLDVSPAMYTTTEGHSIEPGGGHTPYNDGRGVHSIMSLPGGAPPNGPLIQSMPRVDWNFNQSINQSINFPMSDAALSRSSSPTPPFDLSGTSPPSAYLVGQNFPGVQISGMELNGFGALNNSTPAPLSASKAPLNQTTDNFGEFFNQRNVQLEIDMVTGEIQGSIDLHDLSHRSGGGRQLLYCSLSELSDELRKVVHQICMSSIVIGPTSTGPISQGSFTDRSENMNPGGFMTPSISTGRAQSVNNDEDSF